MNKKMMKGFTLIEIMIVVAIIAILAAVAIPNFIKYQKTSLKNTCESNCATIKTAAEALLMENASAVPSESTLVLADGTGHLKEWPVCKGGGTYTVNKDEKGIVTVTCSEHSAAAAEAEND